MYLCVCVCVCVCTQYEEHAMMSQLRDMEHREMVDELNRKISQLETEVDISI